MSPGQFSFSSLLFILTRTTGALFLSPFASFGPTKQRPSPPFRLQQFLIQKNDIPIFPRQNFHVEALFLLFPGACEEPMVNFERSPPTRLKRAKNDRHILEPCVRFKSDGKELLFRTQRPRSALSSRSSHFQRFPQTFSASSRKLGGLFWNPGKRIFIASGSLS